MKKILFSLLILISIQACKQTGDLPFAPSSDKFSFFFTNDLPNFISINDNNTGALIGTITPTLNTEYEFSIPIGQKAETYNVNFIYNTAISYYNGPVQIESFKDVKPMDYRFQDYPGSTGYSYKSVQYLPADQIDSVHNRTQSYFNNGLTELLIHEDVPPIAEVFIKLKNENNFRYHYIDDLNSFSETEISIEALPVVSEIKTVALDDLIGTGAIRIHVKQTGYDKWKLIGNYYSKHIQNHSFSIPIIGSSNFFVQGHYFAADNSYSVGFISKEIPTMLSPIDYNFELINGNLDQFKIEGVDADVISYSFQLTDNSKWNIIADVSKGTNINRPQFAPKVLEEFPSLGEKVELNQLGLVYLNEDNSLGYQELIKPKRRILGFEYEFLNAYEGQGAVPLFKSIHIKL